ncbi:MAG: ABC transporter ATP-binding protein [Pleomorphochaeta sp.]|nr:ABC transporter ATP-binding protein [Sphaerochaetaceae bacterium]
MNKIVNAIEVSNLSISYRNLKSFSIKQNFLHTKRSKKEDFVAVNDVTFNVEKGKVLGIIGKNGSGKSTLLRSLAGILSPDSGTIDLKDNSVSLMSIGVGFQKEISGRENIILSGMLLGFTKEEIEAKMDKIIDFANIGKFIDMPVRTYSSGMYSKLAFSITASLETDIMLIDEVFSVGDQKFKKKSNDKIISLIKESHRTVVIVSHNMKTIENLCDEVIWFNNGKIKEKGETKLVLDNYQNFMAK